MTKILHQLGHNNKWNIDAYFDAFYKNEIGDGFIFAAFSIGADSFRENSKISGRDIKEYLPVSMFDSQFYGSKDSKGGKLDTYSFHPINTDKEEATQVSVTENIFKAIDFQEKAGFTKIIIPTICREIGKINELISLISSVNEKLEKKPGLEYYMTIPFSHSLIMDDEAIEKILINLTNLNIKFDGYYIVCESELRSNEKVSTNYVRYANLLRIFSVLHKEGYKTIFGYANWDSLIFLSLVDIDYITIGTYENLRNFSTERFIDQKSGGPSDGWYFSEKLLNFVRAREIDNLRKNNVLSLIRNENNIFSEVILSEGYSWNTHKPDVHKNYLLSINRILNTLSSIKDINKRAAFMLGMVKAAQSTYQELEKNKVYLTEANAGYHLSFWESFLKQKIS
jgi:hypothetical protein